MPSESFGDHRRRCIDDEIDLNFFEERTDAYFTQISLGNIAPTPNAP
jgi:hypothetical protein